MTRIVSFSPSRLRELSETVGCLRNAAANKSLPRAQRRLALQRSKALQREIETHSKGLQQVTSDT
jgi:hypothetical protein